MKFAVTIKCTGRSKTTKLILRPLIRAAMAAIFDRNAVDTSETGTSNLSKLCDLLRSIFIYRTVVCVVNHKRCDGTL